MQFQRFYVRNDDSLADFLCYYVEFYQTDKVSVNHDILLALIGTPHNKPIDIKQYTEIGPKLTMKTPWCSNALSILNKCYDSDRTSSIRYNRIEKSILVNTYKLSKYEIDPMLESIYDEPLDSFPKTEDPIENLYIVTDIRNENKIRSLGFDEQDIQYLELLSEKIGRNFTNIELYDLAQSNSEHSRHWFFRGNLWDADTNTFVDTSLFTMIKDTQNFTNDRSVVAFSDNASAISGFKIKMIAPIGRTYLETDDELMHITLTAETHNFPTGIAPFPGAATGTGGRIRDTHAIGRGGYVVAGIAGYCVGNLKESNFLHKNIRTLIRASDGASDYGNKFGEPVTLGFCREYGITREMDGQRIEWVKPIMFSGGVGMIKDRDLHKKEPSSKMLVVKIGGPCYRIGVGGGAASSRDQDSKNIKEDLSAVQRGDPEMENKLNRLIRTCIEQIDNPIQSIHDQGAGGTGNVTKEIVYPAGAKINLDKIELGDTSMNSLEKWISEYQEQDSILVNETDIEFVESIGKRESIGVSVIGEVTNNGKIQVESNEKMIVDLPLEDVVGDTMKMKSYNLDKISRKLEPLNIPDASIYNHLRFVFTLINVGSKRFLTNKVDRSVTGLVAQQQCVGPCHTPLSNFSVIAQSHFGLTGSVIAVGERPNIGQIDTAIMARVAVSEMLTNMMFSCITDIKDIRCSGNWMWPLSAPGEKWELYNACRSMCQFMIQIGIAIDGGKDSLSMIYKDNSKLIIGPRQLVITGYAPTENILLKVTPDFKEVDSSIIYIDFANRSKRLGGSALAQAYDQIGDSAPDINDPKFLVETFNAVQQLIKEGKILAGHDISDGGFITTLCEMGFGGNIGFDVSIDVILNNDMNIVEALFSEELGIILEVSEQYTTDVVMKLGGEHCYLIGRTIKEDKMIIHHEYQPIFNERMTELRALWETKSFDMEMLQSNSVTVEQEMNSLMKMYETEYIYKSTIPAMLITTDNYKPYVAMIREEGSNGDREMASAFHMAGFTVKDICMNDFINHPQLDLSMYRGIVFVGGFSYSDVFGAAKGWYTIIKSNERIHKLFDDFYKRPDTFSLGVCNGCQLMTQLGWIPKCRMAKNESGRFESRFPLVKINKTNSIMLSGMAGSMLGVWTAHGEGRFIIDNYDIKTVSCQYIDPDSRLPTLSYPHNPAGSDHGVAAICSADGRHLAMMPHPERSFLTWQWPVDRKLVPTINTNDNNDTNNYSPWFTMFKNAYDWTKNNQVTIDTIDITDT